MGMAQGLSMGASRMQAGKLRLSSRHLRNFVIVLVAVNSCLWALIGADAFQHAPLGNTGLLVAGIAALAALGFAVALWRYPPTSVHRLLVLPSLRYSLATHHAGHIVAAHLADPTRIRRTRLADRCNHHTSIVPTVTETALRAEMTVALGGLVAEEIFAGESGAYAAGDLARATEIAANMVGSFGMAGSAVSLRSASGKQREFVARVLEDARARKDLEAVLSATKQETVRTLLGRRHTIVALRDALLRNGRLDPEQIRSIITRADRRRHDDDKVLVDLRVVGGSKPTAEAGR